MASYPRLQEHRENLGWEIRDLLAKLPDGRPAESSIRRLEDGGSIRLVNTKRVFDIINRAYDNKLDPEEEIIITRSRR